jgi:hypothetical protein
MRPPCSKCGGWLHYQPESEFSPATITCLNCGWSARKETHGAAISEIALKRIDTRPCMTIEKEALICNLRMVSGEKIDVIAAEVGVSAGTVSKVLKANGIGSGGIKYRSKGYNCSREQTQ